MPKSTPGCGGIHELLEIWPEAAETVNPAEIRKIWSDEKMRDLAKSATEDMESGGVRGRCAQAVQDQDLMIGQLEGRMFGVGYRDEGDTHLHTRTTTHFTPASQTLGGWREYRATGAAVPCDCA